MDSSMMLGLKVKTTDEYDIAGSTQQQWKVNMKNFPNALEFSDLRCLNWFPAFTKVNSRFRILMWYNMYTKSYSCYS